MNSREESRSLFSLRKIPSTDSGVVTSIEASLAIGNFSDLAKSPCHLATTNPNALSISSRRDETSLINDLSGAK